MPEGSSEFDFKITSYVKHSTKQLKNYNDSSYLKKLKEQVKSKFYFTHSITSYVQV